jgi:hypothetical protein
MQTHFCGKGLAARQIENVLLEERDAIALLHWHLRRTLNVPVGKTEFYKRLKK